MTDQEGRVFPTYYWGELLKVAFGEPSADPLYGSYSRAHAAHTLRMWQSLFTFKIWAQSLSPEDAAKLFAILSAPEVPTDTSSGSGSP